MTSTLLVTDTHPLIWYLNDQMNRLPRKVLKAFDDAVEGRVAILVPLVVLWELSMAIKSGKVRLSASLEEYVKEKFFATAISLLPIETEDVLRSHTLNFSADPFDKLIVAMALRVECPLITGDSIIHAQSPCEIFW